MPKKTLALIAGLVLVTVVLFVIALNSNQQGNKSSVNPSPTGVKASPVVDVAHSVLSLSPNPINVTAGGNAKVDVNIDTSDNEVTAVQLEIAYDPKVLTNVKVEPGVFFQNSVVLINKNDSATGRYTFAFGRGPSQTLVSGVGVAATISFTARASASPSQLTLLPTSLVTARGVAESVLKSSSGTQVVVTGGAAVPPLQSSPSAGL